MALVIMIILLPLARPISIDTRINARKGFSFAQVISNTSNTMPVNRIINDMMDELKIKDK